MDAEAILIAGTGALACLFAARLSAAGSSVWMLGSWPEGLAALRRHGVCLVEADGQGRAYPVRVATSAKEIGSARQALVLVKAWQTAQTASKLADCLDSTGLALSLQNGMGNRELLAQALGPERVALGTTTAGATLLGPGCARPAGAGQVTLEEDRRLDPLAERLTRAGFSVERTQDADSLIWGKLAINAAVNPLTALLEVPNGALLSSPAAWGLAAELAREAAAVAEAQGVRLPYPDPVKAAAEVAAWTADNRSSMLQDMQRGAPTEIDAICGAIVRLGQAAKVPTPVNQALWQLIKARVETRGDRLGGL